MLRVENCSILTWSQDVGVSFWKRSKKIRCVMHKEDGYRGSSCEMTLYFFRWVFEEESL